MNWKKLFTVLVIPVLALGVNQLSARELANGEWYVQLILTSDTDALGDSYNTLGQLKKAAREFDSNDMPEFGQTWNTAYLSVIFYRPDWETKAQTYNSDYHPISRNKSDEWTFEVRSDDPYRDLSLTWVGEKTNMERMVLVDLQEDNMVAAVINGEPQVYSFRMNGTVREFAWRVLTKKEYKQFETSGQVDADKAKKKNAKKSGWLPRGWGQGKGKGHHGDKTEGLPDNPLSS